MKNSKRMLSFIMAIIVMIGSMGLVSAVADSKKGSGTIGTTAALSTEPKYVVKFTKDIVDSAKWLSNNEMNVLFDADHKSTIDGEYVKSAAKTGGTAVANEDGSLTLSKASVVVGGEYQSAATLEIPVTDDMRDAYLKATNKELFISYYFSSSNLTSGTFKGEYTDFQFRVYTKFKTPFTTDSNVKKQVTETTLGVQYLKVYQENLNKTFKLKGADGVALENLNDVESIILSIYNYNKNIEASIEISGIAYAGNPAIKELVAPEAAGVDEYVSATDWSKHYLKEDFGDTPGTYKFYINGGYDDSKYNTSIDKATKKAAEGWAYMRNMEEVSTRQVNFNFDINPDEFNKALVTAKQPGGTNKLKITCKFPVIEDTTGAPMMGEFQVGLNCFGKSAYTPIQTWIEPNKEYTFEIDVTDIEVNTASTVRIALMAFWKYDPVTKVFYDTDKAKRYDKDGNLLVAKYHEESGDFLGYDNGVSDKLLTSNDVVKVTANCSDGKKDVDITNIMNRFTMRTMQNIEGFISPIYTGTLTTDNDSTTKADDTTAGEYEYAGYHFFDFKGEAYAETYGAWTHASFANFLYDGYYESYEIVDKNYEKDNMKQGYKDPKNPSKKVTYDEKYAADYEEAKSLVSGGYQLELHSPYPRKQNQHQAMFHYSGKSEDARRLDPNCGDHKNLKPEGETYDYTEQMANALKYSKENPDKEKAGYLAIDVYAVASTHGYKNTYNTTYKEWCKKNNKTCVSEQTPIQMLVTIQAARDGEDISAKVMVMVPAGQKKTLYLDVSDIEVEDIKGIGIAAQNYSLLANKEQGGDNQLVGITDVKARYSAIYVPGSKNSDLTTTTVDFGEVDLKAAKKVKNLYDALPGLNVEDYNSEADYDKLAAFIKAWTNLNPATQEYCEKEYGIDYSMIGMLEMDVYERIYIYGVGSPDTGDLAFPMTALLIAGLAGYVIVRTRKRKV